MSQKIEPALSAEEWKRWRSGAVVRQMMGAGTPQYAERLADRDSPRSRISMVSIAQP